jgi:hypothetical protein
MGLFIQVTKYLENVRAQETLASAITIFMGCTSVGARHTDDPNLRARLRPAPFPRPGLRGYVQIGSVTVRHVVFAY